MRSCIYWSFLLFAFALLFLLSFRSSCVPSKSSKLQKLRHIMRDVIAIRHCVGAQQVHVSLRFGRWWRTRFFPTLLSTFSRWASTASSASTPAFTRFSHFTRLVSCRLWLSKTPHAICYNTTAKSKQSCWKAIEMRYAILAPRACFKLVYTHHFEGKKTPALEPVKGATLTPNLSRTLSTLKLTHDGLFSWWSPLARFEGMQIKPDVNAWDGYILSPYQPYSNEPLGRVDFFLHQTQL